MTASSGGGQPVRWSGDAAAGMCDGAAWRARAAGIYGRIEERGGVPVRRSGDAAAGPCDGATRQACVVTGEDQGQRCRPGSRRRCEREGAPSSEPRRMGATSTDCGWKLHVCAGGRQSEFLRMAVERYGRAPAARRQRQYGCAAA